MKHVYLPFLIFLAIIEVPINNMAFALFFDEASKITILLALAVGTILIFFARTIGMKLRHITCREIEVSKLKTYAILGLLGTFSLVIMFSLAKMGQKLAEVIDRVGLVGLFEECETCGPPQTFMESAYTGLSQEGYVLLLLNVVVFTAGLVAAFYRHGPHIDYEKLHDRKKENR
jgi:hypothetical protein